VRWTPLLLVLIAVVVALALGTLLDGHFDGR